MVDAVAKAQNRAVANERLAAIGKMAAHVTHEIRNPLSSIGLNIELLEENLAEAKSAVSRRRSSVRSRARCSGSTSLRGVPPRRALAAAADGVGGPGVEGPRDRRLREARDGSRRTRARARLEDDVPPVLFDEGQIRQAILNVLRNAREAMADGGKIDVYVRAEGMSVVVGVDDRGSGIPDDVRSRIFDPFFSTKGEGTGLGLAITRNLEAHGGTIAVDRAKAEVPRSAPPPIAPAIWQPTAGLEARTLRVTREIEQETEGRKRDSLLFRSSALPVDYPFVLLGFISGFVHEAESRVRLSSRWPARRARRNAAISLSSDSKAARVHFAVPRGRPRSAVERSFTKAAAFLRARLADSVELRRTPEFRFVYEPRLIQAVTRKGSHRARAEDRKEVLDCLSSDLPTFLFNLSLCLPGACELRGGQRLWAAEWRGAIGSMIRNDVPPPSRASHAIEPPCASTICRVIARPRPVPSPFVEKNGSKMRERTSSGMPAPRSSTPTTTLMPSARTDTSMRAAVGHRLARVAHHVEEGLADLALVEERRRDVVGDLEADLEAGAVHLRLRELDDVAHRASRDRPPPCAAAGAARRAGTPRRGARGAAPRA